MKYFNNNILTIIFYGNDKAKMKPKYLTKSRFKIAHEYPVKLFYLNHREYQNNKEDNSFLF